MGKAPKGCHFYRIPPRVSSFMEYPPGVSTIDGMFSMGVKLYMEQPPGLSFL